MIEHGVLFSGDRLGRLPATPASWQRALRGLEEAPTSPIPGHRRALLRAAAVLVAAGLFSMSWDRLLNLQVASYNIKFPSLVFTIAAVLALLATPHPVQVLLASRIRRAVLGSAGAIVVYELVRGAFSAAPASSVAQVAAVLTGAVLPAVALLLVLRDRGALRWALCWVLFGAVVAGTFGLYQLAAFYLGWPQGIPYSGVGIGTSIGRISSFNYEPAYFAYFLLLALGAYVLLRRLDSQEVGWRALIAFGALLYLVNVRAVPLVALALGLLLLPAFSQNRRLLVRGGIVLAATILVALVTPTAVSAVGQVVASATAAHDGPAVPIGEAPTEEAPRSTNDPGATAPTGLQSQLKSVDPNEQSSNAPRLGLYTAVLHEVSAAPVFGIGAGNLGGALRRNAPSAIQDQIGGQVVANNVWLQALADGGLVQLLLQLALVLTVLVAAVRRRTTATYPLAASLLAVLGVGGMLTSYFFDLKVWVALALVLVGFAVVGPHPRQRPEPEVAA